MCGLVGVLAIVFQMVFLLSVYRFMVCLLSDHPSVFLSTNLRFYSVYLPSSIYMSSSLGILEALIHTCMWGFRVSRVLFLVI